MDEEDYDTNTELEQPFFDYQSCLNFLLFLLICVTCPISLPLMAAFWCCQNFCMMGEMCFGGGMGEGTETALI